MDILGILCGGYEQHKLVFKSKRTKINSKEKCSYEKKD